MICPAILDPFQGSNYRINACIHQALLCPLVSKLFGYAFSLTTSNQTIQQIDNNKRCDSASNHTDTNGQLETNHKHLNDINNTQIKERLKHNVITNNGNGDELQCNIGCDIGQSNDTAIDSSSYGNDKKLD